MTNRSAPCTLDSIPLRREAKSAHRLFGRLNATTVLTFLEFCNAVPMRRGHEGTEEIGQTIQGKFQLLLTGVHTHNHWGLHDVKFQFGTVFPSSSGEDSRHFGPGRDLDGCV